MRRRCGCRGGWGKGRRRGRTHLFDIGRASCICHLIKKLLCFFILIPLAPSLHHATGVNCNFSLSLTCTCSFEGREKRNLYTPPSTHHGRKLKTNFMDKKRQGKRKERERLYNLHYASCHYSGLGKFIVFDKWWKTKNKIHRKNKCFLWSGSS